MRCPIEYLLCSICEIVKAVEMQSRQLGKARVKRERFHLESFGSEVVAALELHLGRSRAMIRSEVEEAECEILFDLNLEGEREMCNPSWGESKTPKRYLEKQL